MVDVLTQFGDSSSGIGALGLNVQSFAIQLITFIIAFLVLRKWAFKPILKVLHERRETIEEGVRLGEQMRKDQAEMETKVAEALSKARAEADGIIAQANDSARQAIREAEEKAVEKAAVIVKSGEERAASEMARARKKLESQVVGWVSDATEAIIGEKVDAGKDAEIIDRALKGRQSA